MTVIAGMGHILQLILLMCMLAGASAIHSWEDLQGFDAAGDTGLSLAGDVVRFPNGTELQLFPSTSEAHVQEHINGTTTRRMLGVFRQCSPCTCCDKTRRWCLPTVCCYNIRCGLQGLPYGLCSFIPISCTCFGCRQ